ncbi:MAG: outer membrane protein assembly factor BamD [Burkholderiaceae bacterium]
MQRTDAPESAGAATDQVRDTRLIPDVPARAAVRRRRPLSRRLCGLGLCILLAACAGPKEVDPTLGWTAEQLYAEARDEMQTGRWEDAVKLLEKLDSRFPFGVLSQQAQVDNAYANYKDGERGLALAAVDRFLKLHPDHRAVPYMYYLRGLINFNSHNTLLARLGSQDLSERDLQASREAFDAFETVTRRFPDSPYAPDATLRMRYLRNSMALGEIAVARYYYRRGAHVAAINRAQEVVRQYQDVPAVQEALLILVRSYDALGLTDLRDASQRVLALNFEGNESVEATLAGEKSSWWQVWR